MLVNELPPLLLTSHCTVGAGLLEADAVKVTLLPIETVWLDGLVAMVGAKSTVRVADVVLAETTPEVKTASYSLAFSPTRALNE